MGQTLRLLRSIAWRNLGRNRRRTLIAGAGIAVGVGMCIVSFGLAEGMNSDMVASVTDVQLGHVQLQRSEFLARPKLDLCFDRAAERTAASERVAGVSAISARARAWALASTSDESAGVELLGVDPRREAAVTHLDQRVVSGFYLSGQATPWPAPRSLSSEERALDRSLTQSATERAEAEIEALGAGDGALGATQAPDPDLAAQTERLVQGLAPGPKRPPPLLLGDKLARKLKTAPGRDLNLMATDREGNPTNVSFRVVGIVHTGDSLFDTTRAVGHLSDVQHFLGLGDRAHVLAIRAESPGAAPEVADRLARVPLLQGLTVKTWTELRPDVVAMVQTNTELTAMMIVIIFAVAAIGVADTILMAVYERRRELGVLKAVGMRPAFIVAMVTLETFLLGVGASLAGLVLGGAVDLYLSRVGFHLGGLSSFTLAGASIPPVLHATITPLGLLLPVGVMIGMALLAALWPAFLAARTEPVVAMRER